mgnify:CR=1 FL=1
MLETVCRRGGTTGCVAVLCGALALAGCSQGDHLPTIAPLTCDPPTLSDYAGTWRLTLPSTLPGSTFTHCAAPALDGTAVTVSTETPCPEGPTSPCPVVLTFAITIYLKEYRPGGVPRYGISGTTNGGLTLFGEIDSGSCTASFRFYQVDGPGFSCSGTFAETHHEMFASCPEGWVPVAGQTQNSICDVSPPFEPLVEFPPP